MASLVSPPSSSSQLQKKRHQKVYVHVMNIIAFLKLLRQPSLSPSLPPSLPLPSPPSLPSSLPPSLPYPSVPPLPSLPPSPPPSLSPLPPSPPSLPPFLPYPSLPSSLPPSLLILQYERGRSTADFVKFLNDKCGTSRLPGGKLSPEVCGGRVTLLTCTLYM